MIRTERHRNCGFAAAQNFEIPAVAAAAPAPAPDVFVKTDEQTALLAAQQTYPGAKSDLLRLTGKSWYKAMSIEHKQHALKLVGLLSSEPGGDQKLRKNTLELFIGANAPYRLAFTLNKPGAYGHAVRTTGTLEINPEGLKDGRALHLALNTTVHEVNHLVNKAAAPLTFDSFMDEYRAYYVGFVSVNGRPPTVKELLPNVQSLFTGYWNIRDVINDAATKPELKPAYDQIMGFMAGYLGFEQTPYTVWNADPLDPNKVAPTPTGNIDNVLK